MKRIIPIVVSVVLAAAAGTSWLIIRKNRKGLNAASSRIPKK